MHDVKPKILSCFFDDAVLCSWRKTEKFGFMARCESCIHYKEFVRVMEEEEEEFWDEVDRTRRNEGHG